MKNTFGSNISLTVFGESHGTAIGCVLDGLCAGLAVDEEFIAKKMDQRRARGDGLSTARKEADKVNIISGVWQGCTTGTAVTMVIENSSQHSADYAKTAGLARPGHADYTAHVKYGGFEDYRGGGHFSGRLTAPMVAAGALCESILATHGIRVGTHIHTLAGLQDIPFSSSEKELLAQLDSLKNSSGFCLLDPSREEAMKQAVREAGSEGDSVGGILETAVYGMPVGVGEPIFDSVESTLAHLMFSVPAVKGVEFGAGFAISGMRGSQANDPFAVQKGKVVTATNNNGGINGGITNGMPIIMRAAFKPTPSIYKPQHTVDLATGQEAELQIAGRHDPSIVPRASAVQNAVVSFGLLDLLTARYGTLWQKQG